YPIALGLNPLLLGQFQKQGLGKNLKLYHFPEMDTVNSSSSALWLVNKAPHPNAARLFINWLLTKDAQVVWAREVETNSRRVDVDDANARLCAESIGRRGGKALGITCDVTDEAQVEAMVARARETYGGVDVLVNNAGILGGQSVLDMPLERWNRQIAVNLTGT